MNESGFSEHQKNTTNCRVWWKNENSGKFLMGFCRMIFFPLLIIAYYSVIHYTTKRVYRH